MRSSLLISLSVLLLFACGTPEPETSRWIEIKQKIRREFPQVSQMSVGELQSILDDKDGARPLILDVREPNEFAVSHLTGAQQAANTEQALSLLATTEKDRLIVAYCSVGYRSSRLAKALGDRGFTNVHNLEGSIFEWANQGHAVYRGKTEVKEVHPYNDDWGQLLKEDLRQYGDKN